MAGGLTRQDALAGLAKQFAAKKDVWVRVTGVDGSVREGRLLSADASALAVNVAHQLAPVELPIAEVLAIEVRSPHRNREGMLAMLGIVTAVTALVLYSKLPWVDAHSDFSGVFMAMFSIAAAVFSVVLARTGLRRWLTTWRPLYPPGAD